VAAGQVEHGREVGVHPEQLVEVALLLGHAAGVGEHRDGALRVGAPAQRDAERGRGVQLPADRRWIAAPGDPDGVPGQPLGL
jgi:hypothetical protein